MALRAERVPPGGRSLLRFAERWGVGDDYEREAAVAAATPDDLIDLVGGVDAAGDDFWDWLAGPESYETEPSEEYLALTAVTMAADSARLKLQRRAEVDE